MTMNTRTSESVRGFVAAVAALLMTSLLLVPAASAQSVAESHVGVGVDPGGHA